MTKTCNVIILPTDGKSDIYFNYLVLSLSLHGNIAQNDGDKVPQHLYITSDEEIKERDWYWNNTRESVVQCKYSRVELSSKDVKIIATTDPSLNLPQIPQSFISLYIEEYNAGRKIEKIWVEYHHDYIGKCIPDEEGCHCYNNSLKINPDNTISIEPIKDSWTREEVVELIKQSLNVIIASHHMHREIYNNELDNWIKENL